MGHGFDLIRLVVNASAVDSTLEIGGKQSVALDQKPFECTESGGLWCGGVWVFESRHAGLIFFSLTEILHGNLGYIRAHLCVLVREMEKATCDFDGEGLIAIEREKPNTGSSVVIIDVGAEIEFVKPRQPGQWWEADGTNSLHEKGDDTQPCLAIEGVDM